MLVACSDPFRDRGSNVPGESNVRGEDGAVES